MGENKGQTIFLSVIGIATLLVAIIGATFAYFTTSITNGEATTTGTITAAKISTVTLTGSTRSAENVLPGYELTSESPLTMTVAFTDQSTVTPGFTVPYTCSLVKSGTMTNIQYAVSGADNTTYGSWTTATSTSTQIASGSLSSANTSDVFSVKVRFQETGTDQTLGENGTTGTVTVSCALSGDTYYTNGFSNGTSTAPAAQTN